MSVLIANGRYTFWRKHVIDVARVCHGAMQQIRRTGATHLAIDHLDAVQQFLGHLTPDMWRHYVDRSPGDSLPPKPPDL